MSHNKTIEVTDKITAHLRNPKNKVIIEFLAELENVSISEWVANVLENEVLPQKMSKLQKEINK